MKRLLARLIGAVRSPARQVALSVAFGQTILLVITPILALLYPIDVIGSYQVVYSIAIVAQVLATGGFEYVLPGIANDADSIRAYRRGVIFLLTFTGIAALLVAGLLILGFGSSAGVAIASGAVAVSFGSSALDNARLLRRGDRRALVRRNYLAGAISAVLQLGGFLISPSLWVLVTALALGRVISLLVSDSPPDLLPWRSPDATEAQVDSEGKQRGSSVEWIVSVVLSTATLQAPILITAQFLGATAAAQIALAIRLVSAPASLLGGGVAQGFVFSTAQRIRDRSGGVAEYIRRTQTKLAKLSVAIGLCTLVIGPLAIIFLFTDEWRPAALVVAILALPYAVQLVNRATTPLYPMLGATRELMLIQLVRFVVTIAIVLLCLFLAPENLFVVTAGIAAAALAFQVFFFFFTVRLVRDA